MIDRYVQIRHITAENVRGAVNKVLELTSLPNMPRTKSFAIPQGRGNLVDTFHALFPPSNLVKMYSSNPCTTTLKARFSNAHPATFASCFPLLPFFPAGNPISPCAFSTIAVDGTSISNKKNRVEGMR